MFCACEGSCLYLFWIFFVGSIGCIILQMAIISDRLAVTVLVCRYARRGYVDNPQILDHPIPNLLGETTILPQRLLNSANITTINPHHTPNPQPHLHITHNITSWIPTIMPTSSTNSTIPNFPHDYCYYYCSLNEYVLVAGRRDESGCGRFGYMGWFVILLYIIISHFLILSTA